MKQDNSLERYNYKCDECSKIFNLYEGEGLGFSYRKKGAMLPSTKHVCMDCYYKLKRKGFTL